MKKLLVIPLLLVLLSPSLFAVDTYDKGNQLFSFKIGPTIPAFTHFFADDANGTLVGIGEDNTGMKVGGYGAISYQVFNTPKTAIGGEIGYNFNFSAAKMLFTAVPFYAKYSYVPVQGEWDLPISFGLGGAYIKYNDASLMTLYANMEVGFTWYPGENWGFGLTTGLWVIPEFNYYEQLQSDNALVGIVPITLSITYRQ